MQIFIAQPRLECNQFDVRVELIQPLAGNLRFGLINVLCREEDLSLQVAEVHLVVVGQHQRTDTSACQIKRGGGA